MNIVDPLALAAALPSSPVPDFTPSLPPGLSGPIAIALGWLSAILIVFAVGLLIFAAIKIMRARQNGGGNEGVEAVGNVLMGLIIGLAAAGIVGFLVAALI